MGLFKHFRKRHEQKSAVITIDETWQYILGQAKSKAGLTVNTKTLLQLSAAQACARVITEDLAQIPVKLYKREKDGTKSEAADHPLSDLIKTKPNDWQTSFEFREQIGLHLVLTNNAYIWINRVRGQIAELLPLEPHLVTPKRRGFETDYLVTLQDGSQKNLGNGDIWHIRGPSWNGWHGLDGIRLMRESVGLALALEEHGSRMFSNGSTVGGLLSTDQNLTSDQRKELKTSWDARQSGLDNAYKTAVLWGGMKWTPMAQQNDQAQFLETRRFQVEEVCRAFKVMPIMVGHSDKTTTYASAEQMFIAHRVQTMGPWFERIEQSADCNLLTDDERRQGYYVRFNRNAYMVMTSESRANFYTKMYGIGAINPNEIRDLEDMNPYDGGEQYRVPLNMADPNAIPTESVSNAPKAPAN